MLGCLETVTAGTTPGPYTHTARKLLRRQSKDGLMQPNHLLMEGRRCAVTTDRETKDNDVEAEVC